MSTAPLNVGATLGTQNPVASRAPFASARFSEFRDFATRVCVCTATPWDANAHQFCSAALPAAFTG